MTEARLEKKATNEKATMAMSGFSRVWFIGFEMQFE